MEATVNDWPAPTPLDRLRSRILDTFTPDPAGSYRSYSCRICGVGPITDLGRYAHLRRHDDATREAERVFETVDALWGERTKAVFVPLTDQWWEPTEEPDRYRTVDPCGIDCHHPVHAFHPERRRHTEDAEWILRNKGPVI